MKRPLAILKKLNARRKLKMWAPYLSMGNGCLLQSGFAISGNLDGTGKRVFVGNNCVVASSFVFERKGHGKVTLGDRVHAGSSTNFISINGISIGDDVTIAYDCIFYDHDSHAIDWLDRKDDTLQEIRDDRMNGDFLANKNWSVVRSAPIVIEDKVWIGFGVTVLKGVRIGEGAVIGARSVVTKDIPAYCVAAGNPARVVKSIDKEHR